MKKRTSITAAVIALFLAAPAFAGIEGGGITANGIEGGGFTADGIEGGGFTADGIEGGGFLAWLRAVFGGR